VEGCAKLMKHIKGGAHAIKVLEPLDYMNVVYRVGERSLSQATTLPVPASETKKAQTKKRQIFSCGPNAKSQRPSEQTPPIKRPAALIETTTASPSVRAEIGRVVQSTVQQQVVRQVGQVVPLLCLLYHTEIQVCVRRTLLASDH
jgi:hypothetical protein